MQSDTKRPISTRFRRLATWPALEFATIGYRDFHFEPHFHDHYVIMLVAKGVNLGQRCREKYAVEPGELLLIQPGEMHTGSSLEGGYLRYHAFYPDQKTLSAWMEKAETRMPPCTGFGLKYRHPALTEAFERLVQAVSCEGAAALEAESALLEFCSTLAGLQPEVRAPLPEIRPDSQKFSQARDFIHENFAESFSLDQLAAAAGASPFQLLRLFRKHCGMTPFAYLRSHRIEQSKRLIRNNQTLRDAAFQAGFYDQSHFIHSFRQQTGFLPSDFQRAFFRKV